MIKYVLITGASSGIGPPQPLYCPARVTTYLRGLENKPMWKHWKRNRRLYRRLFWMSPGWMTSIWHSKLFPKNADHLVCMH